MNSQYGNVVFTTYLVLWGFSGLIFFNLSRKAKSIEEKKRIDIIGFVVVSVLTLGAAILLHLPAAGVGLIVVGFSTGFMITQKYTFYCPLCQKKTQHLFTTLKYCPKCGQGRN